MTTTLAPIKSAGSKKTTLAATAAHLLSATDTSPTGNNFTSELPNFDVISMNVGGSHFATTLATLQRYPNSKLAQWFSNTSDRDALPRDAKNRYFLDRDPKMFVHVLNYLRDGNVWSVMDCGSGERQRVKREAEFFALDQMVRLVERLPWTSNVAKLTSKNNSNYSLASANNQHSRHSVITIGYRGTFAFGRDSMADVKFRKLSRILIAGRWSLCKEVFRDTLNDSRDPERGTEDKYSSRFFLKHCVLEQAFEMLYNAGFVLVGACASGTNSYGTEPNKPGQDTSEESKWLHYNEFVFVKAME